MLGIFIIVWCAGNIASQDVIASEIVQSEKITISSSTLDEKAVHVLSRPISRSINISKPNSNQNTTVLPSTKETPLIKGINMSSNISKNIPENVKVDEATHHITAQHGTNDEDGILIKPLDIPQGTDTKFVPGPRIPSNMTSVQKSTIPGANMNDTNLSFKDRASFNGDKCPVGYVKVNDQCVQEA